MTCNKLGDTQMLPGLLEQTPEDENIKSIRGEGVDDTKGCYKAITARGAQTVIPLRKNGRLWKEKTAWAGDFASSSRFVQATKPPLFQSEVKLLR